MRILAANLIVALGLTILSAPGLAAAQAGPAQDRLDAAASALENVQTMRFNGQTTLTQSDSGATMQLFTGTGEFQAPDRSHMIISQPTMSQVNETISVGPSTWVRTVDGSDWLPLGSTDTGSPAPASLARSLRELSKYLLSPSVSNNGNRVIISSDIDVARAVTDDSDIAYMVGVEYGGSPDQGTRVTGSNVTVTIDQASGLLVGIDTSLSMIPGNPPPGTPAGEVTIKTSLSLSDFNSPEISVSVPGGD